MHKKLLTSVLASATAVTMVLSPCITAFADEPAPDPHATVTIDSNSTETSVYVDSITVDNGQQAINIQDGNHTLDADVHVDKDVTSTGFARENYTTDELGRKYNYSETAVNTQGGNVQIDGSLNAIADEQNGINASSGAHITVEGQVNANYNGVMAFGSGTAVTVGAGVSGAYDGVIANTNSMVSVTGDVISTGHDTVLSSEWDPEKRDYKYKKAGTVGTAVSTDGSASVTVEGNAIGVTEGIGIHKRYDTPSVKGSIIITGTVGASGEGSSDIIIGNAYTFDANTNERRTAEYATTQDILDAVPEITVHALDKGIVSNGLIPTSEEGVTAQDVGNRIVEAINYIIKLDPDSVSNYGLKLTSDNPNVRTISYGQKSLDTVNIAEQFKVAASIPDGYEIIGGSNYMDVKDNGDGTYTLKLLDTKGGIFVQARLRPVPTPSGSGSSQEYQVEVEEATAAYADPNQAPAGAIVVNTVAQPSTSGAAGQAAAPVSAISGDKPARTVSYNVSKITPIQYKNSIIQNVAAAPQGGAFNIETDRVTCFDSKMIEAFAARPDVDVNVVFTYGGKRLKVTIPAGYNVKTLLDSNGYCGFLRLLSILGGEELK